MQEDPFYIQLEPDPLEVLKKKKEAQQEVRNALEEQIAARLLTSQVHYNSSICNHATTTRAPLRGNMWPVASYI